MSEPLPPLRPYQQDLVERAREAYRRCRRVLLQSPTGSGKTLMFLYLLMSALTKGSVPIYIVYHRRALVDQGVEILSRHGIEHGVIARGYPVSPTAPVQICGIGTLAARLKNYFPTPFALPRFLVFDEAHHTPAATWRLLCRVFADALILGATATPCRTDGTGLDDLFDELVVGPSIRQLEGDGFLAKYQVYAPPLDADLSKIRTIAGDYDQEALANVMMSERLLGEPVEHWMTHVLARRGALPTIVFCVSVAHSKAIAARYAADGVNARHLDGETPDRERRLAFEDLRAGRLHVISNCGLISEGLDIPDVSVVQILRPTKSLTLYLQMVGRGSRPHGDGSTSLLLDHAGNPYRHGLPNQERRWSLQGTDRNPGEAPVKACSECREIIPLSARICPACGAVLMVEVPGDGRNPGERPGQLLELPAELPLEVYGRYRDSIEWAGDDALKLGMVCKARKYKWGWLYFQLKERGIERQYWKVRRVLSEGDADELGG